MRKTCLKAFFLSIWPLLLLSILPPHQAWAQKQGQAAVGSVTVTLAPPDSLSPVTGLEPGADAYIKKLEPKFKLQVLGLYAKPAEWKKFTAAAAAGRPAAIPGFAMICVPSKMATKSYDNKKARREFKRYLNWFTAAANNRPMAGLLTSQGNKKLKEYMGVDLGFKFRTGEFTKKISESSNSLTLGALVSFNVFGQPSEVYLTATSLQIGDKLVFLAFFEQSGSPEKMAETRAKSLAWRDGLSGLNAGQYRK
ncbi:MAG: hypothetical protein LBP33_05015 [Candidatus Adiutrix sp.]|jgi:hypothetical protein|nr:hypothetical protein [Candidatus Adiutrix sp.]